MQYKTFVTWEKQVALNSITLKAGLIRMVAFDGREGLLY
jgi:tagatose-1,6-bisphosphate aldolase